MNIDNSSDIVFPDYEHSILGTITSILKYYNVDTKYKSSKGLDTLLSKKIYNNVILLILDGLGHSVLEKISPNGYLKQNMVDIVTSVYPSTTTAAMTTYYTGKPPYETGWIAWSQYFKEYGRSLDTLTRRESYYNKPLEKPIIDVYGKFLNYTSIYTLIENASSYVRTYEIKPEYAERKCKRTLIADNFDEIIYHLEDISKLPNEKFIFAYCDNPDSVLHKYGTSSKEAKDFVLDIEKNIYKLSNCIDKDSLIIISADHGHKDIEKAYSLFDYPEIQECLIMPPSLESRVITFWVKNEMRETFENGFYNAFGDDFWLVTKNDFINKYHFLGNGNKHCKIDDFIGDYVAISIKGSIIKLENSLVAGNTVKKSTHCGLTKEEMQVPVIVISN